MIAEDFARVRVLATASIATPMVEGARGQKTGEGAASVVCDRGQARKVD